ncbi:hypothetical protein SAMN04488020_101191 [Palleronia marisminoris]|uniref:Ferric siderophore reductase C-terminal domain-containing protein n=1 Tax=Palleronia marisminoris TaxID=315423 RepID=A0A1Y5RBZ0_9RHOB|nr:hypothetical protein [Palleronia marisminoris]SFG11099.1 hypothetical protein SAMN04488020_101191 [Palleronia marisminoris]SLN13525.1 hypothetical protein PAM7066_00193 [Palleronia marisminoris]
MTLRFALSRTAEVVDKLVALNARAMPAMGSRDHAAWVMNVLAHVVGPWLVAQDAAGRSLASADARSMPLMAALGDEGYLGITLDADDLAEGPVSPPAAAVALARVMAPAVNALAYAGPLAPRACWRLAGDGLAWGWSQNGDMERGREILTAYGAPFANRQLVFDADGVARRGGCCRYLAVSGAVCLNCPLTKGKAGAPVVGAPTMARLRKSG